MKKNFPFYKQPDAKDCGPTCLRIVSKYYGKSISLQQIRNLSETTREGSSLLGLSDAAEDLGFRSLGVQIDFNTLAEEVPFPCIVHWNKQHFVVVYKIDKNNVVYISDPSYGLITYTKEEFIKFWIGENANETTEEGIALILCIMSPVILVSKKLIGSFISLIKKSEIMEILILVERCNKIQLRIISMPILPRNSITCANRTK